MRKLEPSFLLTIFLSWFLPCLNCYSKMLITTTVLQKLKFTIKLLSPTVFSSTSGLH